MSDEIDRERGRERERGEREVGERKQGRTEERLGRGEREP